MTTATLACQDEQRRRTIRYKGINGIDYVEVSDDQYSLCVHFFGQVPDALDKANVRIEGGRRIRDIRVMAVEIEHSSDPELEDCLRVTVDKWGDFSTYTLRLVSLDDQGRPTPSPLPGFDPRYAQVEFSFKVGCPSDLDCKLEPVCPPEPLLEPEINYLAKDYASFRQLLLDRLALLLPDWQERHVPDLGIALVEVLAYTGDYLSYYQDAVATEAYLNTARQRISVRRHVRLVDYRLHEGCNARTWVCVQTDQDTPANALPPGGFYFITDCAELAQASGYVLQETELHAIPPDHYEVFEPLLETPGKPVQFYAAHSEIQFYTWGDQECCLPRGATQATLVDDGRKLHLNPGDVLLFEEVQGPNTGNPADADPAHRHVVRLTQVEPGEDPLYQRQIVEIEWAVEDALPFPLCLSSTVPAPDCSPVGKISVARGNVILVDHGRKTGEPLGTVPVTETVGECDCDRADMTDLPGVFRPVLQQTPLTFSQPLPPLTPASQMLSQDPRQALPQITLTGLPATVGEVIDPNDPRWQWFPRYDLLESQGQEQGFVVEIDNDGYANLRFGDGNLGRMPPAHTTFTATYRVGNGPAGNVGAETIAYLILRNSSLSGIDLRPRNPLPAQGGTAPEPLPEVKLFAPSAFRKELQRAITADDYAELAGNNPQVQRAAAALRWTGSWYEARVAIDPLGTETADAALLQAIAGYLYRYRRMGHDLVVQPARYVPLDIELQVCVLPPYLRGHVEAALLAVFSNRVLPAGRLGFFHPDNLSFGQGIYLSKLVATAQAVQGVQNVTVTRLERLYQGPNHELENGILPLDAMEIAQLDNDPSFHEHGKLTLILGGGR